MYDSAAIAERARRSIRPTHGGQGARATHPPPLDDRPQQAPENDDLPLVVAYLREQRDNGTLNTFTASLLTQFDRKGTLTDRQVSAVVRKLDAPAKMAELPAADVVPDGRYALRREDGELYFVRVWRGDYAVRCYLLHGPNESRLTAAVTLQAIVDAGPVEAALLYGEKIRKCSKCDKRLTNRLSRALKIGPICGGRFYDEDDWATMRSDKRAELIAAGLDPNERIDEHEDEEVDFSSEVDPC